MQKFKIFCLVGLFAIFITACKKDFDQEKAANTTPNNVPNNVKDNFFVEDRKSPDEPTGTSIGTNGVTNRGGGNPIPEFDDEIPTILGAQLTNPYNISNMTAAYNITFGTNLTSLNATDLYIRFEPTTEAQFALLEDSLDLAMYDHPLDYEVVQDGDYYVDPAKDIEDLPYLYTVVEPDFNFPAGIPYTILARLHIPANNLFLEDLAESMAAGATYRRTQVGDSILIVRTDISGNHTMRPPQPCEYLPSDHPDYCGGWGGVGNPPPPPPPSGTINCGLPGLSCVDDKRPRGRIRVWDTQLNGGSCVPLVNVKVTAKRWFKGIRKAYHMYTNNQGEFTHYLQFKRKVTVRVFFRNANVSIRPMRTNVGIRLSLFTVKSKIGVFENCAMNTIDHIYYRPTSRTSKGFMYWLAANGINARKYQWDQALADGVKPFTGHRLCVYLVKENDPYFSGPDADLVFQNYIFKEKTGITDIVIEVAKLTYYTIKKDVPSAVLLILNNVFGSQRPDILYKYDTHPDNPSMALTNLSSNEVVKEFYESFTEAGVLKSINNNQKWSNYFKRKKKEIDIGVGLASTVSSIIYKEIKGKDKKTDPVLMAFNVLTFLQIFYYSMTEPEREFFDMIRGFSDFYAHYLSDRRYGVTADAIYDEKQILVTSSTGNSSHKRLLENWQPNYNINELRDERLGIYNDMIDNDNDFVVPFGYPQFSKDDFVTNVKVKELFESITGTGSNNVFGSPGKWSQFIENIKIKHPTQQTVIDDLKIAYLIQ